MGLLLSDNFAGSVIDSLKWTETDPNSRISQNDRILISNPHSASRPEFTDYLKSVVSASSGVVVIQANVDWSDDSAEEAIGGIYLYKDSSNYAAIVSRGNGGEYRLRIRIGGSFLYDNYTNYIAKGKDVKIVYTFSTNLIQFFYWNTGTSAWVQIGTNQTYNLGTPLYFGITAWDLTTFNAADTIYIDNAYFSDADYSSQYPVLDFTYQGDIPLSLLPSSSYSLSDYVYQGNTSLSLLPSSLYLIADFVYLGTTLLTLYPFSLCEGSDLATIDTDIGFLQFVAPIAGTKKIVLSNVPDGLRLSRNHITAISNRRLQNGSLISQVIASRKKSFSLDLGLYDKSLSVYFESIYENNESVSMTVYEYNSNFLRVDEYSLTVKIARFEDSKDYIDNTRSMVIDLEEV